MRSPPRFISLKWKTLALTSAVTAALAVVLSTLSHISLVAQFEEHRQTERNGYTRQIHGLLEERIEQLKQTAWMLSKINPITEALQEETPAALRERFGLLWPNLQVTTGLEIAHFFDVESRFLAGWDENGLAAAMPTELLSLAERANRGERPIHALVCTAGCRQYVAIPLLSGGRRSGVLLLASNLADTVLAFHTVSGVDVALLIEDNAARETPQPLNRIEPWNVVTAAVSNAPDNLALLRHLASESSEYLRDPQVVRTRFRNRSFEIAPLPVEGLIPAKHVFLLSVADITAPLTEIHHTTRTNLRVGLGALAIGIALLLLILRKPMERLTRTAMSLPLLAQRGYDRIRSRLGTTKPARWGRDEADVLSTTTLTLCDDLERLERQVQEAHVGMQNQMEALQQERDFNANLLNTAEVIILTQDRNGRIQSMNAHGEKLIGCPDGRLCSQTFVDLIALPEDSDVFRELEQVRRGQRKRLRHSGTVPGHDDSNREIAWLHSHLLSGDKGPAVLSIGLDMTEQKRAESRLAWLTEHDPLTGLANRRRFERELKQAIAYTDRYNGSGAVFLVDIDEFRFLNDTIGREAGDMCLQVIGQALGRTVRNVDLLARLHGDEFAILVRRIDEEGIEQFARKTIARLAEVELPVATTPYRVSASIGIARIPQDGTHLEEILSAAESAVHSAKKTGRGRWRLHAKREGEHSELQAQVYWKQRVRQALEQDAFVLYYQPIQNLRTGTTNHYEALVRMVDEDGSIIAPGKFIPACESSGVMQELDDFVLRKAIAHAGAATAAGYDVHVAVNLSARALDNPDLLCTVQEALDEHRVDPGRIIFELTETTAVGDFAAAHVLIETIRDLGCRFALDDFGSGFSSFHYLKVLPVDYLKIDGTFIRGMESSLQDQTLVQAMADVARSFGKYTVAEFVENERVLELIQRLSIDFAQGFQIGKPMPFHEVFPNAEIPEGQQYADGYDVMIS